METFFQSNIFFIISIVSIIIVATLVILVVSYVLGIVRDVKKVTKQVRGGVQKTSDETVSVLNTMIRILSALFLVSVVRKMQNKKMGTKNNFTFKK